MRKYAVAVAALVVCAASLVVTQAEETKSSDEPAEVVAEAVEGHGPEVMEALFLVGSIGAAVFTWMIFASAFLKHKISFRYHLVFIGLIAWGFQINPDHFIHELTFASIAVVLILLIIRVARGVYNKVEFESLDEEQTKVVIWALGPMGSGITTPAAGTTFKGLRGNLKSARDKCIAMHWLCNIGGGVGVGDFPFVFVLMTFAKAMGPEGIWEGVVWQAKVMLPIMFFHMFFIMPLIWGLTPMMVWRHKGIVLKVLLGFRYSLRRCIEPEEVEEEPRTTRFGRFVHAIRASEEEAEVMRVFTAQALAIGLLVPFVVVVSSWIQHHTGHVYGPATLATAVTTKFADNYAATATFWSIDEIIAIMVSIIMGAAYLFGNMANLSFLGNTIEKLETLKYGILVWPTVGFGLAWHFYIMPDLVEWVPSLSFLKATLPF